MTSYLVIVLLLLLPPIGLADISSQYHNYFDTTTVCGMSPLNARVNKSLLPIGRSAPYIWRGRDSEYGEWPFLAWVWMNGTLCNGVIVSSEMVVTADHCLNKLGLSGTGRKRHLDGKVPAFVQVGKLRHNKTDEFEAKYDVEMVQGGAYFKKRGFIGKNPDFARLWLREPIQFNDYTLPICISSRPEVLYTLLRSPLFFVSHGMMYVIPERRYPEKVQWIQMKPFSDKLWGMQMTDVENQTTYSFVGAEGDKITRTCSGDSGGPLVALDENKRWSLIGLNIMGLGPCYKDWDPERDDIFVLMPKILGIFDKNFKPLPNATAFDQWGEGDW